MIKRFLTSAYLTIRELTAGVTTKLLTRGEVPEAGSAADRKSNILNGAGSFISQALGWGLVGFCGLAAVAAGVGFIGALIGPHSLTLAVPLKMLCTAAIYGGVSAVCFGIAKGCKTAKLMRKEAQGEQRASGIINNGNAGQTNLQSGATNTFNNNAQPGNTGQQQQNTGQQNNRTGQNLTL